MILLESDSHFSALLSLLTGQGDPTLLPTIPESPEEGESPFWWV